MAPFVPNKEQPLNIFFEFTTGGLFDVYEKPNLNTPMHMRFTQYMGGIGDLTLTFLDQTGFQVEEQIWMGNGRGNLQFGYQGSTQLKSPIWPVYGIQYKPLFRDNSFEIDITASIGGASASTQITTQQHGTFQEILDSITPKYPNIKVVTNPPVVASTDITYTDKDSTEESTRQHCKWMSETDYNFLVRIVKFAQSADGKSGYLMRTYPDPDKRDGFILEIFLPGQAVSPNGGGLVGNNYWVYQHPARDPAHMNVISWAPDIDFIVGNFKANQQVNHTIPVEGSSTKIYTSPQTTTEINPTTVVYWGPPLLAGTPTNTNQGMVPGQAVYSGQDSSNLFTNWTENADGDLTAGSTRAKPGASFTNLAGANKELTEHLVSQWAQQTGILTVFGDPGLIVGECIHLDVYYPKNYDPSSDPTAKHYTTGDYLVTQAIHDLGVGTTYTTELSLTRINKQHTPGQEDGITTSTTNGAPTASAGSGAPTNGIPQPTNAAWNTVVPSAARLGLIDQALKLAGLPTTKANEDAMNLIVTNESSWRAGVVLDTVKGTPSGLAQVKTDTFAANAVAGHTDILNPVDNMAAASNYVQASYPTGDPSNAFARVPGVVSVANGGPYKPY